MAAAAEASARSGSQRSEGQPAPPADGILAAEAATRELAPGSPATLVLGADGVEPRVRLGAPAPGVSLHAKLSLSYRSGGSVMGKRTRNLVEVCSPADSSSPGRMAGIDTPCATARTAMASKYGRMSR